MRRGKDRRVGGGREDEGKRNWVQAREARGGEKSRGRLKEGKGGVKQRGGVTIIPHIVIEHHITIILITIHPRCSNHQRPHSLRITIVPIRYQNPPHPSPPHPYHPHYPPLHIPLLSLNDKKIIYNNNLSQPRDTLQHDVSFVYQFSLFPVRVGIQNTLAHLHVFLVPPLAGA